MIARRAVLAALLTVAAGAARAQATDETALLRLINTHRAQAGLGPLVADARLQRAAVEHAEDLARRNRLAHTDGAGEDLGSRLARLGYIWRVAAENVATGSPTAAEVLALWLASDGHRRNLLLPEINEAGVARAGQPGRWFWVLVVARRGPGAGG